LRCPPGRDMQAQYRCQIWQQHQQLQGKARQANAARGSAAPLPEDPCQQDVCTYSTYYRPFMRMHGGVYAYALVFMHGGMTRHDTTRHDTTPGLPQPLSQSTATAQTSGHLRAAHCHCWGPFPLSDCRLHGGSGARREKRGFGPDAQSPFHPFHDPTVPIRFVHSASRLAGWPAGLTWSVFVHFSSGLDPNTPYPQSSAEASTA
jgi:hypothetical protein